MLPRRQSPPARLFAEVDAERRFGDDLMNQERLRRVEAAAAARVAEQALQLNGGKEPSPRKAGAQRGEGENKATKTNRPL